MLPEVRVYKRIVTFAVELNLSTSTYFPLERMVSSYRILAGAFGNLT